MKKTFLSLFVILSVVMTMISCTKPDEDDVYVGTISYALNENAPSQVVVSPIISLFQENLDGVADVTNTNGSFIIKCKNKKNEDAVEEILADIKEKLQLMMDGELRRYIRSCDVMVFKYSKVILEVHFIGDDTVAEGHSSAEGTVPGFNWQ